MKLLDLFCGAGGAAKGYEKAGFEVVGVDIKPQPNYPFAFEQDDVLLTLQHEWVKSFDVIHASPPCQFFSAYKRNGNTGDYPNLIPEIRELLENTGLPYVIENVEGAPLKNPTKLCGSMFGLDVRRHRLFETNFDLPQLPCYHEVQMRKGKRFPGASNRNGRYTCEVGVWRIPLEVQKNAMGVDWNISLEELSEAIPPAYTEWIGRRILKYA